MYTSNMGYHRWKALRDLIESRGGLEMVDRRYYTGYTNAGGQQVRGRAARWHMAGWLMDRLEDVAASGYRDEREAVDAWNSGLNQSRGGSSLEQGDQEERDTRLQVPRIVQFRRSFSPTIGLIWAGTVEDVPRLAG